MFCCRARVKPELELYWTLREIAAGEKRTTIKDRITSSTEVHRCDNTFKGSSGFKGGKNQWLHMDRTVMFSWAMALAIKPFLFINLNIFFHLEAGDTGVGRNCILGGPLQKWKGHLLNRKKRKVKYSIVEYIKEEAAKLKKSNIVPSLSSHCLWNTLHQPSSDQAEHNSTKKLCNIKTISKFPSDSRILVMVR